MSIWHEYVQTNGRVPEWPYPINYNKVNEVVSDVLVIGGGVAGLQAAINAAKKGVKVTIAERGHAKRSGAGGAGVDHWHGAVTNPCSSVTPEMYTRACYDSMQGWTGGHVRYIINKESWDTLLDCEKMGVQIRDVNDEFKGADFRDEETKLMFAYDYKSCNLCVEVCPIDVMMPNPEKKKPPIVLYPEECWYCGGCVEECPRPGVITILHPTQQRISVNWKRKDTGRILPPGHEESTAPEYQAAFRIMSAYHISTSNYPETLALRRGR